MPVISNATVATGTGLSVAGGGRKIVRTSDGIFYAISFSSSAWYVHQSNDGITWTLKQTISSSGGVNGASINVDKYNNLHLIVTFARSDATGTNHYSAVPHTNTISFRNGFDSGSTISYPSQTPSSTINEAGTELHAAWSSKNATYPNSFNIRYAKGTINGDGSVTWGAVEQVTTYNNTSNNSRNPSIILDKGSIPVIFYDFQGGEAYTRYIFSIGKSTGTWVSKLVFDGSGYEQKNPSAIFVPTAINGLANGRLWVAWHGKDATDSAKFNVRVSYSDDGGVTWATPVKLTSGNLYDRQNVSLAADKTGKVFALYEEHQWSPDLDIYMRTFSGGSWGAPVAVADAEPAAESNPSALVDYSLMMTTPPFVFMSGTDGIKFSGNFNVGASVSPASGALGNKETATLTGYTVTPEAGSTVTSIVEKVNGVTVNTFNNPASLSRTLTVPTATWGTLAYFATHTASVTVTDSNGATTVTTYSFDKRLATGASLLEATKANTDAKNRISQKRDALAAQVGLSAGSTFDAISAQLASGQAFKKFATGTVSGITSTSPFIYAGSSSTQNEYFIEVTNLQFKPSYVATFALGDGGFSVITSQPSFHFNGATAKLVSGLNGSSINTAVANFKADNLLLNGGFKIPVSRGSSNTVFWIAFG